jgi:apolipoprotein N-acyltransferase
VAETGWWFGFGYHFAGLFWIGEAFLVEAAVFGWLLPFAVTTLPAGLALFMAGATAVAARFGPTPITRALALAPTLGIAEWLRGHVLTGFPWNVLGYALTAEPFLQSASVLGIYGLTLIAVLVFALPVVLWREGFWVAAFAMAVLPLLSLMVIGGRYVEPEIASDAPTIRIVQPSVQQREKWRPEHQRRIFDLHLTLSHTSAAGVVDGAAKIDLIVWPEAAMPFVPLAEPVALADIGHLLPPSTTLASGALRVDPPVRAGERQHVYNSLLLFRGGPSAKLAATYDKTHLVPFGEYLPMHAVMERLGLRAVAQLRGSFSAGAEPRPLLEIEGVGRVAPLICYEAIFPGRVVQTAERPRALLAVTNDGWFGDTTGPRQHFHMARVRAVEEGLPVIRAANNGISALIDPRGGVGTPPRMLAMNVQGTIDAQLPQALPPPFYARYGDMMFWLWSIILGLGLVFLYPRTQFTT